MRWERRRSGGETEFELEFELEFEVRLEVELEFCYKLNFNSITNSNSATNPNWTGRKLNSGCKFNLNWLKLGFHYKLKLNWPHFWILTTTCTWTDHIVYSSLQIEIKLTSNSILTTNWTWTERFFCNSDYKPNLNWLIFQFRYNLNSDWPVCFYLDLNSRHPDLKLGFYYKLKLNQPLFEFPLQMGTELTAFSILTTTSTWTDLKMESCYKLNFF